jgi:protein-tyrosine-phosphatase
MFKSLAPAGYAADSCGTDVYSPRPVSNGSFKAAKKYGLSLKNHRSKQVSDRLVTEACVIYCLTSGHASMLKSDYPDYADKIKTLADSDIRDPFGGSDEEYLRCAEQIYSAVKKIVENL